MADTMRDAFEAFAQYGAAGRHIVHRAGDGYLNAGTQKLWLAWQASHEAGRQLGMEQARAELAKTGEAAIVTYHKDDEGQEAVEAYAKIVASVDIDGLKKIANWVAHGARVTLGPARVTATREDWAAVMSVPLATPQPAAERAPLTVWFGSMPESNGKRNWTVLLRRKDASGLRGDISNGFCVSRSEYYDQMRYCADRLRFLIGELAECPSILDYPDDTKEPPANGIGTTEQAKGQA